MIGRRRFAGILVVFLASAAAARPAPAAAAPTTVAVKIRVLKAARAGPAAVDARLTDLQAQLGKLSYARWDEVGEQQANLETNKAVTVSLPDGSTLELTLVESAKDTVTFEMKVPQRKTRSKLTIAKEQRIVHQVTEEKDGVAYFASVRAGG